jgi:hypothetical protein
MPDKVNIAGLSGSGAGRFAYYQGDDDSITKCQNSGLHLIGWIDPNEPAIVQQRRKEPIPARSLGARR